MNPQTIWTIGHSTHELDHFLSLLEQASIRALADVRRFPGSRRQPQFQHESFERSLAEAGIDYHHLLGLGGRRTHRAANSPNVAWRVESFNAYADHMQTDEFKSALAELERIALHQPTAMMCAEAVPWRCHRRLIADALVAKGWDVFDIYSPGRTKPHELTEFARIESGQVIYPGLIGGAEND